MKKILLFCCLTGSLLVNAQQKGKEIRTGNAYINVLQSTMQRTLPGRPGAPGGNGGGRTKYSFLLVWKDKTPPASFFWKGQDGWLTCDVQKVHNNGGGSYVPAGEPSKSVAKGDTLIITPVTGGKFAVPPGVTSSLVNTLFFKTAHTGWMYYTVKKFTPQKDIILP